MKKAAILAAALALVLSLAACGNKDNGNSGNNSPSSSGQTNNGPAGSGGQTNNSQNGTSNNSGMGSSGDSSLTGNSGSTQNNNNSGANNNAGTVRGAVDDMGRAVEDMLDGNTARSANMSSFQRMLDNARVHDVDGVLTDGENSRW